MKTITNFRTILMAVVALLLFSCATRYANTGTASDRTGINGATNGTGKAPKGNTHSYKY